MKERYYYLDVVRVLACLMVIVLHSPMPVSECSATDTYLLAPLSYLASPCIGLFFMASGALLLPSKEDGRLFLKRRFGKIFFPTLVWTCFYLIIGSFSLPSEKIIPYLGKALAGMLFSAQGHGILWFMYTLIGLYLLVPLLSPWWHTASKREIELYIGIWLLTTCYPYLRMMFNIPVDETNMLYYFSGYGGYFMLGAYLNRYGKLLNKALIGCGIFLFSLFLPLIVVVMEKEVNFFILFGYLSVSAGMMCIGWFTWIQRYVFCNTPNRFTHWIVKISNMSFGIYLIHIFVMRTLLWKLPFISSLSYVIQVPLVTILTFACSWGIVALIHKTAWSRYIIGC